ncbi:hypothetical protein [Brevibacterium sp. JSBI002]|uniref:hypothetical protein n=1 Tax=Brevibacterium sp. JSBI002 TaxID=2886045 RepID=UPI0022324049|nr:hypothetical protein [Brevibacterium sp. JSBI002]UZD63446.1 hypothetical protein LJ362_06315 [Brevibacterium sp. JSBI002]
MTTKDEKNLSQVTDKIAKMDEPERSLMQRAHDIIVTVAPVSNRGSGMACQPMLCPRALLHW